MSLQRQKFTLEYKWLIVFIIQYVLFYNAISTINSYEIIKLKLNYFIFICRYLITKIMGSNK